MFERLGSWTYRFRFLIVIAWVIAGVFMGLFAPSLAGAGSTDQTSFLPAGAPSKAAQEAIERAFPGSTSASSATITLYRAGGLTPDDIAYRDAYAAWATSDEAPAELRAAATETETADSRPELETLLRSEDDSFEILVINLDVADAGDEATAVVEQLREHLVATTPAGLETHVTGAAAISSDYLEAVKVGTDSTTVVTIILVVVVLLAIYRAPLAALIPLITIGGAYVVSTGVLGFLAAAGWQVSSTLATFLVVMVFGVGTDYAIFLISRYREEVSSGGDWHDAARTTVRRIGAVITASAGTVIVGMLAMGVGDFKMIASMGPGIAIAVAVTLVAGLTLAPALLSIFGHYLFWPLHTRKAPEGEPRGFFASLASAVSRRPALVTAVLLVALLVPVLYVPQMKTNFDVLTDLPTEADSRLGLRGDRGAPRRGQARPVHGPDRRRRRDRHARAGPAREAPRHPRRAPRVRRHRDHDQPHHARRRHDDPRRLPAQRDAPGDGRRLRGRRRRRLVRQRVVPRRRGPRRAQPVARLRERRGRRVPGRRRGHRVPRGERRAGGRARHRRAGPRPERPVDPAADPVLVDHVTGQRRGRRRRLHAHDRLSRGARGRVPRGEGPRRVPGRRARRVARWSATRRSTTALALVQELRPACRPLRRAARCPPLPGEPGRDGERQGAQGRGGAGVRRPAGPARRAVGGVRHAS